MHNYHISHSANTVSLRTPWFLWATLAAALLLRLPGIQWGLPPATPQVAASGLRSSYAFDEQLILTGVAKANTARLDLDPRAYQFGTLHLELVLLALDGAQAAGVFGSPWRIAYHNLIEGDFARVYVVGRLAAVATALLTVWLLFCFPSDWAGPFAAMLVAVSPSHMLQSDQVRVDVTMTALVLLTLFVALRTAMPLQESSSTNNVSKNAFAASGYLRQFLLLGITAGLAVAAKYSALTAVAAIALAALWLQRFPWRAIRAVGAGTLVGFSAGSPYLLIKLIRPHVFYAGASRYVEARIITSSGQSAISMGKLLVMHAVNIIRFSMGVPAFLLAACGIVWMLRRRSPSDWMLLAGIAGSVVILVPLRWPLIRYDLPLSALLGLCTGLALEQFGKRWRYLMTAAALVMPLGGSIAQLNYMSAPHPANLALQRILEVVPPGSAIARLVREEPPLDEKVYPMGANVLLDDLTKSPPPWVLTTDLPESPYPEPNLALLRSNYEEVAHFESRRVLAWATLGEDGAPQDWKYTHPTFTLYRKRTP